MTVTDTTQPFIYHHSHHIHHLLKKTDTYQDQKVTMQRSLGTSGLRIDVKPETRSPRRSTERCQATEIQDRSQAKKRLRTAQVNPNVNMYRTHKCLLIHDPYMQKFEQEKFSRWFDAERIEADSFTTLLKNNKNK